MPFIPLGLALVQNKNIILLLAYHLSEKSAQLVPFINFAE